MPNLARAPRADSADTRQRILDASERLFSERGFSGTSLRAIAEDGGVNLAAANYHFGSKQQLLETVFLRCVAPINSERLRRLDELEAQPQAPSVADIVRAFVEPNLPLGARSSLPALLAKLFAEPKELSVPLLEQAFGQVGRRFFAAVQRLLPNVTATHLRWRFHFLVGAMVHLTRFEAPLNVFGQPPNERNEQIQAGIDELIEFAVAGLQHDNEVGVVQS